MKLSFEKGDGVSFLTLNVEEGDIEDEKIAIQMDSHVRRAKTVRWSGTSTQNGRLTGISLTLSDFVVP